MVPTFQEKEDLKIDNENFYHYISDLVYDNLRKTVKSFSGKILKLLVKEKNNETEEINISQQNIFFLKFLINYFIETLDICFNNNLLNLGKFPTNFINENDPIFKASNNINDLVDMALLGLCILHEKIKEKQEFLDMIKDFFIRNLKNLLNIKDELIKTKIYNFISIYIDYCFSLKSDEYRLCCDFIVNDLVDNLRRSTSLAFVVNYL